ncbi:MAG: hypothetical protein AAGB24_01380 [Bacteroidota bacterium]
MKISAMAMVSLTTFLLVMITIMVSMDFAFNGIFYLTVFGQVCIVYMVYKVLTDTSYTTSKTFDDLYEDYPIRKN